MELFDNYSEEDQKKIMSILNVVQTSGWSAKNDDQYNLNYSGPKYFKEKRIKELENDCEKANGENNQQGKEFEK